MHAAENPLEWPHVSKLSSQPAVDVTKKNASADDIELFRAAIGEVRRVEHNQAMLQEAAKPKPVPRATAARIIVDPFRNTPNEELVTLFQEDKMAFLAPGVQKTVLKKLRRGYYGLDADIDLHGQTSREAQQRLAHFLQDCMARGWRCLLIVHGKGYNSPDNQPILKNELNLWLRQHQDVLAFCSAPQKAGGAGAVYVLLRSSEKFADEDIDS
jgi:DNA-nicking Smr family endonuclease